MFDLNIPEDSEVDTVVTPEVASTVTPEVKEVKTPASYKGLKLPEDSEEFSHPYLEVSDSGYGSSTSIPGFYDPFTQIVMGGVDMGATVINAIDAIPAPAEVVLDPLRVLDYPRPVVNFAISSAEWTAELLANITSRVTSAVVSNAIGANYDVGSHDADFDFGRVDYENFGKYPEDTSELGVSLQADKDQRHKLIRDYKATFEKKHGSSPYITEVLSFMPDIMTMFGGSVMAIPKIAGLTEGVLSGAHAETAGEDVTTARIWGSLGGVAGTKVADFLLNNLSLKEKAVIAAMEQSPGRKEDAIALLEFYKDHPKISESMLDEGPTGVEYIDRIKARMAEDLGGETYKLYMETLASLGTKTRLSMQEVTDEFSRGSQDVYNRMTAHEKTAWDRVNKQITTSERIPVGDLAGEIDRTLKNSPPVIKNFAKQLFKADKNSLAIKTLDDEASAIHNQYLREVEFAPVEKHAELKAKAASDIERIETDIKLLKGDQAEAATSLSPQDIIDKITLINDKAFVKGSNVNTGDRKQAAGLLKLRRALLKKLEGFEDFDSFDPLYRQAKQASSDKFNIFGYSGGKNKGKLVETGELGKILEETGSAQLTVVSDLMSASPAVFNAKINKIGEVLTPRVTANLKKYYVEQTLNDSLLMPVTSTRSLPKVNTAAFEETATKFLDKAEGRKLILEAYPEKGPTMLKQLAQIRGLMGKVNEFKDSKPMTTKSFIKNLPKIVATLFGTRITDNFYMTRMLKGYGRDLDFDWDAEYQKTLAAHLGGGAAGAIVAPEGEELTGMGLGATVGKSAGRLNSLRKQPFVSKILKRFK